MKLRIDEYGHLKQVVVLLFCCVISENLLALSQGSKEPEYKAVDYNVQADIAYLDVDDRDMGTRKGGDESSLSLFLRPEISWNISPAWQLYSKASLFTSTDVFSLDDDDGGSKTDGFISINELWARYHLSPGRQGSAIQLGRLRIRESSGAWWDQDIESIRYSYETRQINGFIGIAEKLDAYRSDNTDYDESDDDIFNILGQWDYQWRYQHHIALRFLYSDDKSDSNANDMDDLDALWVGAGLQGRWNTAAGKIRYTSDLMVMDGDLDVVEKSGSGLAITEKSLSGWAMDARIWHSWKAPLKPRLGLQFALTDSDGDFRQTGLQSNRAYLTDLKTRFYRYGELYRPELSNIQIITVFAGMDWQRIHELNIAAHHYTRRNEQRAVVDKGISAALIDGESSLGSEIDLIYTWNMKGDNGKSYLGSKRMYLKAGLSVFMGGDAYGDEIDNAVYQATIKYGVKM